MRIETIIYIKEMLEKDIKTRQDAYNKLSKLLTKKQKESGANWRTPDENVNENIKTLRSMKRIQKELLYKEKEILVDFLQKDWN